MIIFAILFLVSSNAVTLRRDKSILFSRVAITILLFSCLLALGTLSISYLDKGIGLYGGLFHATSSTQIFQIFIFILSAIILQLTGFYPRKVWIKQYCSISKLLFSKFIFKNKRKIINKMAEQFKIIEYPLLLLFIITGAIFLVSSSDLVSIFLSIELQSYGLYLLSTLYRNSELATSGGLTYFLLGGLSSSFILLATSLLYANSATTNLDGLYVITSLSDMANDNANTNANINTNHNYNDNYNNNDNDSANSKKPEIDKNNNNDNSNDNTNNILYWYKPYYINFSLLIMSVGFLFKVSAAPFHFWSPDVYDAIPTIVTTFVAIVAKISIFIFLLELVHYTNNSFFTFQFSWRSSLLISCYLSLIIGTVLGLSQFRIKRLFAYSTISHLGFILLALTINSIESSQAFIFYLMQYSISNLNAFTLLVSIGFSLYCFLYSNKQHSNKQHNKLLEKNNSPLQLISEIKGYFYINPVIALSLAITIFSFVGIPPLIGFFAKQMVLSAALDNNYLFLSFVAIVTSVVSAVYYLGIIKQVFFIKPYYKLDPTLKDAILHGNIFGLKKETLFKTVVTFKHENIVLSNSLTITISILTLVILLFIFTPQEWLSMANILALILFNP